MWRGTTNKLFRHPHFQIRSGATGRVHSWFLYWFVLVSEDNCVTIIVYILLPQYLRPLSMGGKRADRECANPNSRHWTDALHIFLWWTSVISVAYLAVRDTDELCRALLLICQTICNGVLTLTTSKSFVASNHVTTRPALKLFSCRPFSTWRTRTGSSNISPPTPLGRTM